MMFVFLRQSEVEREGGYFLAGCLFVDLPKDAESSEGNQALVVSIIDGLLRQAIDGDLSDVNIGCKRGDRFPDGLDVDDDAAMAAWAKDRLQIGVRVNPTDAMGDNILLDTVTLRQLGFEH